MSDREFLVLTTGGLLLASGIKRAESALTRDVRGNVLRRVDAAASGWRRRASNTGASLTVVVGGLVLLHQLAGQRRNGEQPVHRWRADGYGVSRPTRRVATELVPVPASPTDPRSC